MNQYKAILHDFCRCFSIAPLPIVSLFIYLGLTSSNILPAGLHASNGMYHPAYLGWYDFVLGYSILFSFVTGSLKLELKDFFFGLILFFIITTSWTNAHQQDKTFIIDGIVCFFRFLMVYVFAKSLVHKLDYRTAESLLILIYGMLSVSAILWYSLQFGEQNRMAASAMTSASFGQLSAMMCLVFYARKNYSLLFFGFIFLFLSFSRTSLLLFFLLIIIQNRQIIPWNLLKYVIGFVILAIVGIMIMKQYGGQATQVLLDSRFSTEEISNLNGRSIIWTSALEMIQTGQIPFSGVGFHMTPTIIKAANIKYLTAGGMGYNNPSHFHNILLEYALSFGIFSIVIFYYLVKRIWQTFQCNCCPAFFIYSFFLIAQTLDYTIFAPKEIIIFALMLGLAEGQVTYES